MEDGEGKGYECQRRRVPEVISKLCNSYGDKGDSAGAARHAHQEDGVTDLSCVSSGHITLCKGGPVSSLGLRVSTRSSNAVLTVFESSVCQRRQHKTQRFFCLPSVKPKY